MSQSNPAKALNGVRSGHICDRCNKDVQTGDLVRAYATHYDREGWTLRRLWCVAEFEQRIEELRNLGLFEDPNEKLKDLQAEVAQLRQDVDELLELKEDVEELKALAERVDEVESTRVTQEEAEYIAARAGPNEQALSAMRESVLDLRYHREWRVKCDNCDQWTVPGQGTPLRTHCGYCEQELWKPLNAGTSNDVGLTDRKY